MLPSSTLFNQYLRLLMLPRSLSRMGAGAKMMSHKIICFSREVAVLEANRLVDIICKRWFGMVDGVGMQDLVPIIHSTRKEVP